MYLGLETDEMSERNKEGGNVEISSGVAGPVVPRAATGPRKLLYMVVRKSDLKSVSNPQ